MRIGGRARLLLMTLGLLSQAEIDAADQRLRSVPYAVDEIYLLRGNTGFQIDLEFERDERFVGMGSGDVEALSFDAQDNHLFIKPKAVNIHTNLTVLTNRRVYHFEYVVVPEHPGAHLQERLYALRFEYPPPPARGSSDVSAVNTAVLAAHRGERNDDYWFCGEPTLRPAAAWDDGVHTHLRFGSRTELPAVFVRNDDGSQSLLNFSMDQDEMVIHRIARQFAVRRGKLSGCIVNRSYRGSGQALENGTIAPAVNRETRAGTGSP